MALRWSEEFSKLFTQAMQHMHGFLFRNSSIEQVGRAPIFSVELSSFSPIPLACGLLKNELGHVSPRRRQHQLSQSLDLVRGMKTGRQLRHAGRDRCRL